MFPLVILASLTDWEVRLLLVLILYRKSIRNAIGAVTFPTQHRHSFARSICTNQFVHYSIMELVLIKLFQQLEVSKIQNNTDYRVCSAGTCIKSFKWQYLNTSCNVQNGRRHNAQMNIHLTYNRINSWNEREIACTILRSGNTCIEHTKQAIDSQKWRGYLCRFRYSLLCCVCDYCCGRCFLILSFWY